MTIQDLINLWTNYQKEISYFFLIIPILAMAFSFMKKKYWENKLLKIIYSFLIYLISIPWILAILLLLYTVFILGNNILELNLLVYFLPLLSMGITFWIINKVIWLKEIPWFWKISSLLLLIFLSFIVVFLLQKMFIWIIFVWSFQYIIIAFVVIFIWMKMALDKLKK